MACRTICEVKWLRPSVESFRTALETDAVGAFTQVAQAIAQLDASEASAAFEDLGLNGIRVRNVFTALSTRTDLLTRNVAIATEEFERNTSLQKELAVFLESTSNQFLILRNTLIDVAIELGQTLLPAVQFIIASIKTLAESFLALPSGVKATVAILSVLAVGVVTLGAAIGLLLLALPGVVTGFTVAAAAITKFQAASLLATTTATGFNRACNGASTTASPRVFPRSGSTATRRAGSPATST